MIKAIGFLSPLEWWVENFSFKKTEDSYPGSSDPGEFFDRFTCVDNVEGLNVPTSVSARQCCGFSNANAKR